MLKKLIRKIRGTKSGFTLIELIVVIAILAILAAVLIPLVSGQINRARDAKAKSDLNSAFLACQMVLTNGEADGTTYKVGTDEDKVKTAAESIYKSNIKSVELDGTTGAEATGIKSVSIEENDATYTYSPVEDYTKSDGGKSHFEKGTTGF